VLRALESRSNQTHRVEQRRIASGPERVERPQHPSVIARPGHCQPDFVRKCGEQHFIFRVEPLDQHLEGLPRVGPTRIVCGAGLRVGGHAATDVEQDADAHRHVVGAELRDRAALAGIPQLELIGRQAGDEPA